jgi:hypothetical protein
LSARNGDLAQRDEGIEMIPIPDSGTFNGNVTADADGRPVTIGNVFATDAGIQCRHTPGSSDWTLAGEVGTFSADPSLIIRDQANLNATTDVIALVRRTAVNALPAEYTFQPRNSTVRASLGRDLLNERWYEVNGLTFHVNRLLSNAGAEIQSSVISPSQISSNQNDYAPTGITHARHLRLSTDASRTLTGLTNATAGNVLTIWNVGAQDLVLSHENASSTAIMRFACPGAANVTLNEGDGVDLLRF